MTDQYYSQEDKPVESSETAITNWQQQSNSVAAFVPQAAEDLTRAEAILGEMYAAAEQAQNAAAMESVSSLWGMIQQTANNMAQLDAAREAAVAVIQMIDADRKKAETAYDELNSAVENIDEDDPRIAGLVEDISQDIYDYQLEIAEENMSDFAYDQAWEQVHEQIQDITKASWQRIHRFVGALQGWREITDEQRALLVTLLQTFNPEMDEVDLGEEDGDDE